MKDCERRLPHTALRSRHPVPGGGMGMAAFMSQRQLVAYSVTGLVLTSHVLVEPLLHKLEAR
jgi:hypothetical protein